MRWLLPGAFVFGGVLCGLLGLTAGINFNPQATVRFVPDWGSLGDWVSGIGALLAVAMSLHLVRRSEAQQRERERELIEIEQWGSDFFCSVRVISKGFFPCTIKAVFFFGLDGPDGSAVQLGHNMAEDGRICLPKRLECREDIQFAWRIDKMADLLNHLSFLRLNSMSDLGIKVVTVTGEVIVPISAELSDFLIGAARAEKINFRFGD